MLRQKFFDRLGTKVLHHGPQDLCLHNRRIVVVLRRSLQSRHVRVSEQRTLLGFLAIRRKLLRQLQPDLGLHHCTCRFRLFSSGSEHLSGLRLIRIAGGRCGIRPDRAEQKRDDKGVVAQLSHDGSENSSAKCTALLEPARVTFVCCGSSVAPGCLCGTGPIGPVVERSSTLPAAPAAPAFKMAACPKSPLPRVTQPSRSPPAAPPASRTATSGSTAPTSYRQTTFFPAPWSASPTIAASPSAPPSTPALRKSPSA